MAFPAYQSATQSVSSINGEIDVDVPSGLTAGDAFIVSLLTDGSMTVTPPSGFSAIRTNNDAGNGAGLVSYLKTATGSEGATVKFTWDNPGYSGQSLAFRVNAWDSGTAPATGGAVTASGDPDAPSVTPAGGAKDYLWLAVCVSYGGLSATYNPTNYTAIIKNDSDTMGAAYRQLNASSTDPGQFPATGSAGGIAQTIAIYPFVAPSDVLGAQGMM